MEEVYQSSLLTMSVFSAISYDSVGEKVSEVRGGRSWYEIIF